jgi:hypothetical protein
VGVKSGVRPLSAAVPSIHPPGKARFCVLKIDAVSCRVRPCASPAPKKSSRLVDENGPAPSTAQEVEGGHRLGSYWQLQLSVSHWAVRASTDEQRTGYALGVAKVSSKQLAAEPEETYDNVFAIFVFGRPAAVIEFNGV